MITNIQGTLELGTEFNCFVDEYGEKEDTCINLQLGTKGPGQEGSENAFSVLLTYNDIKMLQDILTRGY